MKRYGFYHRETGLLANVVFSTDDENAMLANNTPADHIAIEGHHDSLSKRVDIATGQVIDYQPPAPSADHEWNAETKRWQLNAAVTAKAQARAAALAAIAILEGQSMRPMRELALGIGILGARSRLAAINSQIASLRKSLSDEPAVGEHTYALHAQSAGS